MECNLRHKYCLVTNLASCSFLLVILLSLSLVGIRSNESESLSALISSSFDVSCYGNIVEASLPHSLLRYYTTSLH